MIVIHMPVLPFGNRTEADPTASLTDSQFVNLGARHAVLPKQGTVVCLCSTLRRAQLFRPAVVVLDLPLAGALDATRLAVRLQAIVCRPIPSKLSQR